MLLTACAFAAAVVATPEAAVSPPAIRPIATDRPTLTFAPTSVDAGHLQLETDAVLVAWDGTAGAVSVGGSTLRVGLTPQTDLQVSFPTLSLSSPDLWDPSSSTSITRGGFALRLKWNLVGNDGGAFALGVLPALAISGDDVVSASVTVPVSVVVFDEFMLGAMVQGDVIKERAVVDSRALASVFLGHEVVAGVNGYFEARADIRTVTAEGAVYRTNLLGSAGLLWPVTSLVQLDAGLRVPLVGVAPTLEVFTGVSVKH